jgi:hypothetical protein
MADFGAVASMRIVIGHEARWAFGVANGVQKEGFVSVRSSAFGAIVKDEGANFAISIAFLTERWRGWRVSGVEVAYFGADAPMRIVILNEVGWAIDIARVIKKEGLVCARAYAFRTICR